MGRIDDELKKLCEAKPEASHDVIVVLTLDAEETPPEKLGMVDAEPIPFQPGMFKVRMRGKKLLELAKRPEVEEVGPDSEVKTFDDKALDDPH